MYYFSVSYLIKHPSLLPLHKWVNDDSSDWWKILAVLHPNLYLTSLHSRDCLTYRGSETTTSDTNNKKNYSEKQKPLQSDILSAHCELSVAGISKQLSSVLCCPSAVRETVLVFVPKPGGLAEVSEHPNTATIHNSILKSN